jgi:hypothetical protein
MKPSTVFRNPPPSSLQDSLIHQTAKLWMAGEKGAADIGARRDHLVTMTLAILKGGQRYVLRDVGCEFRGKGEGKLQEQTKKGRNCAGGG